MFFPLSLFHSLSLSLSLWLLLCLLSLIYKLGSSAFLVFIVSQHVCVCVCVWTVICFRFLNEDSVNIALICAEGPSFVWVGEPGQILGLVFICFSYDFLWALGAMFIEHFFLTNVWRLPPYLWTREDEYLSWRKLKWNEV